MKKLTIEEVIKELKNQRDVSVVRSGTFNDGARAAYDYAIELLDYVHPVKSTKVEAESEKK